MGEIGLTVVVPAFDEGPHVREHLARIARAVEAIGRPFEILLVDDGSRDATAAEAAVASAADPRIRVLSHGRNLGKGAALATGAAAAKGDVLVFLDADLEISADEIAPLLARLEAEDADVAVASKYLEGSRQRRPLHRVALSRLYLAVTSLLFRLPIRDTQTGLKILRSGLARAVVPAIRTRRFAWDIELLLLAHRTGARIVQGPVSVDFLERGARIGLRGFVASGVDTLGAFVRDRLLGAYGRAIRAARGRLPRGRRPTRFVLSGDDLGLSPSVDRGLLGALARRELTSVSFLAEGPSAVVAASALRAGGDGADVGVHVDLARGRLGAFLARSAAGLVPASEIRRSVGRQVEAARALDVHPTHLDAHRHAFLAPSAYRALSAEARARSLRGVRFPTPVGSWRAGSGAAGLAKGALLFAAGIALRGLPHAYGLAAPDGIVDAAVAQSWVRAGRLPIAVRGRTVEVIAHPAEGPDDLPADERGIDRSAEARRLVGLAAGLRALGAKIVRFDELAAEGVGSPASRRPS